MRNRRNLGEKQEIFRTLQSGKPSLKFNRDGMRSRHIDNLPVILVEECTHERALPRKDRIEHRLVVLLGTNDEGERVREAIAQIIGIPLLSSGLRTHAHTINLDMVSFDGHTARRQKTAVVPRNEMRRKPHQASVQQVQPGKAEHECLLLCMIYPAARDCAAGIICRY